MLEPDTMVALNLKFQFTYNNISYFFLQIGKFFDSLKNGNFSIWQVASYDSK